MDGRGEGRDDAWGYPHPAYDAQDLSLIAFGYLGMTVFFAALAVVFAFAADEPLPALMYVAAAVPLVAGAAPSFALSQRAGVELRKTPLRLWCAGVTVATLGASLSGMAQVCGLDAAPLAAVSLVAGIALVATGALCGVRGGGRGEGRSGTLSPRGGRRRSAD